MVAWLSPACIYLIVYLSKWYDFCVPARFAASSVRLRPSLCVCVPGCAHFCMYLAGWWPDKVAGCICIRMQLERV